MECRSFRPEAGRGGLRPSGLGLASRGQRLAHAGGGEAAWSLTRPGPVSPAIHSTPARRPRPPPDPREAELVFGRRLETHHRRDGRFQLSAAWRNATPTPVSRMSTTLPASPRRRSAQENATSTVTPGEAATRQRRSTTRLSPGPRRVAIRRQAGAARPAPRSGASASSRPRPGAWPDSETGRGRFGRPRPATIPRHLAGTAGRPVRPGGPRPSGASPRQSPRSRRSGTPGRRRRPLSPGLQRMTRSRFSHYPCGLCGTHRRLRLGAGRLRPRHGGRSSAAAPGHYRGEHWPTWSIGRVWRSAGYGFQ